MSEAPTLEAKAARVDLFGQPLLARLELTSNAERVALLGDWSALFRLLSGEAELAAGTLQIAGVPVPLGVERGVVGLMRLDPLLPSAWSAEQLLTSSAELAGTAPKAASKLAFQTLERLGLAGLAARRLTHLHLGEPSALLVAHALVTDPRVLCREQPLRGFGRQQILQLGPLKPIFVFGTIRKTVQHHRHPPREALRLPDPGQCLRRIAP